MTRPSSYGGAAPEPTVGKQYQRLLVQAISHVDLL